MGLAENKSISQLWHLDNLKTIKPFLERIKEVNDTSPLKSNNSVKTLQMNIGKVCNLSCKHCHVEAGPHRIESMSQDTMAKCLQIMEENQIPTLDITGGAPELNPNFPWLVEEATHLKLQVIVRTNLTVLDLKNYAYLSELYAEQKVELVSSLPYYTQKDADRQRGDGVFQTSIKVLARLNELGFGQEHSDLKVNLVYNPGGAFLPPAQKSIEADYRRALLKQHDIRFNNLYTITNVPVGRYLTFLHESGNLQRYMERLESGFNAATINQVMCRDQLSVSWDGYLYDCDFNQMLGLNCTPKHISEFDVDDYNQREIIMHNHCYACTAGSGSSCGGTVVMPITEL